MSTLTVLELAAGGQYIPDKLTMRTIYARLRSLDDGLPPIEKTNLLRLPSIDASRKVTPEPRLGRH